MKRNEEILKYAKTTAARFASEFNCNPNLILEDLISEATVAVLYALKKQNNTQTFNTYLYKCCRGYLFNFLQKEMKFSNSKTFLKENKTEKTQSVPETVLDLDNFTPCAQSIIQALMEQPPELLKHVQKSTPAQLKKAVKIFVKSKGFTRREITYAIEELELYYA